MKTFHLGDILSITTGLLLAPGHIAAVHELLDYMTGDALFTHQLPRATDECRPALLTQHPQLVEVTPPADFDDDEHVWWWLAEQIVRYGTELPVTPLAVGEHTVINPFDELAMNHPHLTVIPVVVADEDGGTS